MKPATPLPWKATKRSMQLGVSNIWMTAKGGQRIFNGGEGRHMGRVYIPVPATVVQDMEYAQHACNAYPQLVDELKVLLGKYERLEVKLNEIGGYTAQFHSTAALQVHALLRAIGEVA